MINVTEKIPNLYETDHVPLEEKIIHQVYRIPRIGFYWLIAEYDPEKQLAFGYANLNNDLFAEWGYIDVEELLENGAVIEEDWEPCKYQDAVRRVREIA